MTTISSKTIQYKGEDGNWHDFKKVIRYSANLKRFIITLPELWKQYLDQKEVWGETQEEVEQAWREAERKVDEKSKSKRKVIVYHFRCTAMEELENEKGEFLRVGFRKDEIHFAEGTALDFRYDVCYEVKSSLEKHFTYLYLNGNNRGSSDDSDCQHVMEWTPLREAFFKQFKTELITLIKKMDTFLHQEPNKIMALVDQFKNFAALPEVIPPTGETTQ